jgi:hypothetical protein
MQAELRLADFESNKSDFLTTSRVGVHRLKKKTTEERFVKIKFVFMIFGHAVLHQLPAVCENLFSGFLPY